MERNIKDEGIVVLSLFDGMSCAQLALQKLGVKTKAYYASEIDKHAIKVTQHNFPDTIQIGDVTQVRAQDLPKIDLLLGGSPCQGFSFAGKQLAFDDPRSKLFFEFVRIKNECNPTHFLLENVKMKKEHELIISKYMGVAPIEINSALLSAQNRQRLYWTNIYNQPYGLFGDMVCNIPQPKDKGILLKHVLEDNVPEKYYLSDKIITGFLNKKGGFEKRFKPQIENINPKAACLTANMHKLQVTSDFICTDVLKIDKKGNIKANQSKASCFTAGGNSGGNHSDMDLILEIMGDKSNTLTPDAYLATGKRNRDENGVAVLTSMCDRRIRRLTPNECKRLQTVPYSYDMSVVSDTQQYRMLGNGWTIDVIAHILSYAKL